MKTATDSLEPRPDKIKAGPHPCEPALNSVANTASPDCLTKPIEADKITVPTSNKDVEIRRFTLFSTGDSYVDVPPMSRFLHIERNNQGKPVLVCALARGAERIEWRRVVCVPAGSDLRQYAGWYGIPKLSGATLWFLDPQVYDHNCKPLTP